MQADFDHSPWSEFPPFRFCDVYCKTDAAMLLCSTGIVFLAMGGIGLGKAVLSSGLLDDM